ncbi:MAG: peptide-methionine (S)-S-oxide reductase, partial [Thermodesulfovibrionales bacterium]|nr:peptide-methionine (S)-S-oxide reductase [Thermodesulfovibrionales bacterium]
MLQIFWQQIDPTDGGGQFADRGEQYCTAIFYHDEQQRILAEKTKTELEKSARFSKPIVTKILPAKPFYKAEDYHQDFSNKNFLIYKLYRLSSGGDIFLKRVWGDRLNEDLKNQAPGFSKPPEEELRQRLTPL